MPYVGWVCWFSTLFWEVHVAHSQDLSVVEKKTLVQAGHLPPKIWEVNQICVRGWEAIQALSSLLLRESVRINLILWSDEHRQKVLLQVILCTTHGIRCERQKVVQIDQSPQKILSRGSNFHPCWPYEGLDSSSSEHLNWEITKNANSLWHF